MIPRDNALHCESGVIRLFGAADIRSRGMVLGWSDPEEGHSWNDGPEAHLAITMASPVGRLVLSITGEPYVTRKKPVQDIEIFANGARAVGVRLVARNETPVEAILEPEWWFHRAGLAMMTLQFVLRNSSRPKDNGDGLDGRELGFCFRSICLRSLEL
jgi:hypothetical protein